MENRHELLVRVAQLYYEEDLNQSAIADILHTSRPTVSRLLEEAKSCGIVEITVHDPIRKDFRLSQELRKKLKLRDAVVVSGTYDYNQALHRCCEAAIQSFYGIMDNNMSIGISWGLVPQIFCELMECREYYNVNVVQMVGCMGTGNPNVDGLELAIRMSKKLHGTYSNIYSPVYVKRREVWEYLMLEPSIQNSIKKAMSTNIIITGVGSMDSSSSIQRAGYWTDEDRIQLEQKGAVGHLLARPYDKDGNPVEDTGWYAIGAPLEAMKAADWSIGISAKAFKVHAVLGAVRGGYINTLVVDQELAEALLKLADE